MQKTIDYLYRLKQANDEMGNYEAFNLYEAIEELERLQNRNCGNCIYGNKNMIKDKIVCDICVSINRKGMVDKTFCCNKWELNNEKI